MANNELGRIPCLNACGNIASVYQAKRKGAHLYWRCPECGLSQQTGKKVQARLYWETDFNGGEKPPRPENVGENKQDNLEAQPKKEPKKEPDKPDFDPTEKPSESVNSTEKQTENEPKTGLKAVGAVFLLLASVGALVWKM